MGIGNNELVTHEENNFEELSNAFIEQRKDEFDQYLKENLQRYMDVIAEEFCVNHEAWGEFVLDDWTNAQNYDDDSER